MLNKEQYKKLIKKRKELHIECGIYKRAWRFVCKTLDPSQFESLKWDYMRLKKEYYLTHELIQATKLNNKLLGRLRGVL